MRPDFGRPTNASVLKGKTPGIPTELYGFYKRPIFESKFLYQTMRKVHKKTTTATTNGGAALKIPYFRVSKNQRAAIGYIIYVPIKNAEIHDFSGCKVETSSLGFFQKNFPSKKSRCDILRLVRLEQQHQN